ncbi:MAG: hypothetical protein JW846_10490 [Dehalococcoidia bacterium]|nr:hypothetical protein [Dehalococcoidia bacterium]
MWSYVLYFLIGGTIVSAVAYVGTHSDGMTAAFVASLPTIFIINILLLYHNGGVSAGMTYARGALLYLPLFVACVSLTMFLLPRIDMVWALVAGLSVYGVPTLVRHHRGHRVIAQTIPLQVPALAIISSEQQVVPAGVTAHEEQHA